MPPIKSRARVRIAAPVVQTAQFLFEVIRTHRRTRVELERRCEDARRHRPMTTLEFPGDDAVEVHHPQGDGGRERDASQEADEEQEAPARRPAASHAAFSQDRRRYTGGSNVGRSFMWVSLTVYRETETYFDHDLLGRWERSEFPMEPANILVI